jgi:Asp-tRNA(Asn)/Glu-tRNA(Gln) amidotransferase A subunit family amidase
MSEGPFAMPASLADAVDAIARSRMSAAGLAELELARIAATDGTVNAWETLDPEHVRREARRCDDARGAGLLAGIGIGVKDIIATNDHPTTMGSPIFAGHRPASDATCIARMREAGAFVFGKTVTTPFAFMDPGKTSNPWNAAYSPGGSSSGSAAAVAAGHVLGAIGTQTNGSVVRPAAYCGVVGFKPTLKAIPVDGMYAFSVQFDTIGTLTRTVADAARLASVLADSGRIAPAIAPRTRPPRLAFLAHFPWTRHDAATDDVLATAVARLGREAEVVPIEVPADWREANRALRTIMLYEAGVALADLQARERGRLTPNLNAALDEGRTITGQQFREAQTARARALAHFTNWLGAFDAVLAPSAPGPAPHGLATTGDPSCCTLWSFLGFPAINLPIGLVGGLPVGLQLAAPQGRDDALLAVAAWCEARLPFAGLV